MPSKQAPLVIGMTGPIGSGVSTVSHILEGQGFHRVSLSRPIKVELLKEAGRPSKSPVVAVKDWRKKLQDIGDSGRELSPTYWLDKALKRLPEDTPVVVDGIRNLGEVEGMRNRFPNFFLFAVVASPDVRWKRLKATYKNDLNRFERDDHRDSEDKDDLPNGQQVGRCVNAADYVFINEADHGSHEAVVSKLEEVLRTDIGQLTKTTKPRDPHEHEVHMTEAYALAYRSRCMKRYVGAVIVDKVGLPLSAGFNENPVGMKPCVLEWGRCFKDDLMHKELEALPYLHCPKCGRKNEKLQKPWRCSNPKCREDLKRRFYPSRNMEKCTAIHAEERAIRSLAGRDADGATMYVTTFPCLQCARYIVDAGIKKVVFVEAYPVIESAQYLALNGVAVEPFCGFTAGAFSRVFKPAS